MLTDSVGQDFRKSTVLCLCCASSEASARETWTMGLDSKWLKTEVSWRLLHSHIWYVGQEDSRFNLAGMIAGFRESKKCKNFKNWAKGVWPFLPSLWNHPPHLNILLIVIQVPKAGRDSRGEELTSTAWWGSGKVTLQRTCEMRNTVMAIFGKYSLPQHNMNI